MEREEIKVYFPYLKAFAEDKEVQCDISGEWKDMEEISFSIGVEHYRIKPVYRPFKNQEECWQEMHKHHDFGWVKFCSSICFIQNISFNKITVISDEEICSTSFEGGFTNMKFADGTPFGIKEESD